MNKYQVIENTEIQASAEISTPKCVIPFSDITISPFNQSYGIDLDDNVVGELATSISQNELINPLTIIKNPKGDGYYLLAGVHRLQALKNLRGEKSGLLDGEFRILPNKNESDDNCFKICVAENRLRHDPSPFVLAKYVTRIIEKEKINQDSVAKVMRKSRATINRLLKLFEHWDQLPESWQADLKVSPTPEKEEDKFRISFSHFSDVAAVLESKNITELQELMTQAHDKCMSTREFKRRIGKLHLPQSSKTECEGCETTNADTVLPMDVPETEVDQDFTDAKRAAAAAKALKFASKSVTYATHAGELDSAVALLKEASDLINHRIGILKESRKANSPKTKETRSPRKASVPSAPKTGAVEPNSAA